MRTVSALDAKNRFGQLLDAARRAPVTVTKKGRPAAVLLSVEDYARIRGAAWRRLLATVATAQAEPVRAERPLLGTVVLGPEILIGAFLARGAPFEALCRVLDRGAPVFSDATFLDLAERIFDPGLDRCLGPERRAELLADLEAVADWTGLGPSLEIFGDPAKDRLLETAFVAEADCLVTGERDLLMLDPLGSLRILTPAGLLEALAG